jgi:dCMP deaminase
MNKIISDIISKPYDRIDWDDYFISTALLISCRSSCERLHVGCVLVKNNRIISAGYNGFISGAPHNSIVVDNHEQATVHAEMNAVSDCAMRGVNINGAIAYITHYPCINCFKILISAGIKTIKYLNDYKNDNTINCILNSIKDITIIKI